MTLHIKKEPLFKQNKDFSLYEENKKENLKELIIRIKEKEEEGKEKRKDNLKLLEDLQKQKIKEIENKQEKYQKKYEEREKKLNRSHSGLYYSRNHLSKKIIKSSEIPKEKLYDVRTKYDKNKGWSFGMKYNINLNQKKDDPDFPYLLSDFDKITSKPKNVEIKFRIPRFKEIPKAKPNTAKLRDHINDETREKIRKMGERNKIIKSFLNERKRDLERVLENKGINEEEREQRIEELIRKIPRRRLDKGDNFDYYINDINYTQVEERSPNYTMKGRYQHGSIFDSVDDSVIKTIDEEKLGTNGKPIQNKDYLNNIPMYNIIKPTNPSFSFSQANRFIEKKSQYQPSVNIEQIELFKNGEFAPKDNYFLFNFLYFYLYIFLKFFFI
jgi:hypothetical protein